MSEIISTQELSTLDIFKKIWFRPRQIFRYIEDSPDKKHLIIICAILGIVSALSKAIDKSFGDKLDLEMLLLINISMGAILGWLNYFFYAIGISWTGFLFGGHANWKSLFKVLIYGSIPTAFSVISYFVAIPIAGITLFQTNGTKIFETPIGIIMIITNVVLAFWSLILIVIGISEIQKFSIWKALINGILPFIIFMSLIGAIVWLAG